MTADWRDALRVVVMRDGRQLVGATFRGVPFFVESADRSGGRRTVTHEFPLRDSPFVEDLGRRARVFSVEGYVLGASYVSHRNDLLAALEDESGPGALVHPYHGERVAICSSVTVRDSIADGGMSRFSIEFTEAPAQQAGVDVEIDFPGEVSASATVAIAATQAEFDAAYSSSGMPAFSLESASRALDSLAARLGAALAPVVRDTQELARLDVDIRSLRSRASSLVRHPAAVLGAFQSVLAGLADTVASSPGAVVAAFVDAYGADTGPLAPLSTALRRRERANQDALTAALRRILAIEAARLAPLAAFATEEEATAARDDVAGLLDEQAATASDDAYPALVQLRADLARAVPGDAVLARLVTIERRTATPSILLSYQLYGSVDREADLVARNRTRHPGVMGGSLRVLSE